jgi:CO/xanthine dehydrogenase FAD-binding subunit
VALTQLPCHLIGAGRIADIRLAFGSVAPTVVRAFDT